MNKLELVVKTMDECRIPGVRPTDLTSTSLTREVQLFAHWCDQAWLQLQNLHNDWGFLQGDFSFNTVAGDIDYTPAQAGVTDLKAWNIDTLRCYLASAGVADDQWLVNWGYSAFRDTYQFGTQVNGRPMVFTVHPRTKSLLLGSIPDAIYTVYGQYWKRPSVLAADSTELPIDNETYHMMVVYKAMTFYGYEQSATEFIARGTDGWNELLAGLEREELPDVEFGGPLA